MAFTIKTLCVGAEWCLIIIHELVYNTECMGRISPVMMVYAH